MGEAEVAVVVEGEIVEFVSTAIVPAAPAPITTYSEVPARILQMPEGPKSQDIIGAWLTRRSPETRRTYEGHLTRFFQSFPEYDPEVHSLNQIALEFCTWPPPAVATKVSQFKEQLLADGKSAATINGHMAAVRSLLKLAHKWGLRESDARGLVENEKATAYRNTAGPGAAIMRRLISAPAKFHPDNKLKVLRDTAMMRLFCENGLRRSSILRLDVEDYKPFDHTISVFMKGHGTEKTTIWLTEAGNRDMYAYAHWAGLLAPGVTGPMFRSLDRNPKFHTVERLTEKGCWKVVMEYGRLLGVTGLHPHALRHGAITLLMELCDNDVAAVQKYTGHADYNTVLIYADNLKNDKIRQKMTNLLSDFYEQGETLAPGAPRKGGRPKKVKA
jgi:integrase/recombinase XerC